ncbi:leucine-rich repeat domain-containing protein, partial [Klebsiella pneumoniae]|uniref:leucine-rich repeat domain-containing protein n=1 Tax=Klebsiella pneumoniae TaxID=573 RepID=UPI0025A0F7E0
LEKCTKLEELSFENNLIQSFSGLENMENLIKLNLNNNEIIYTDDLYQNKNEAITVKNIDFINLHRLSY